LAGSTKHEKGKYSLQKVEECKVLVRNIPDDILAYGPEVRMIAMAAKGKEWDEVDIDIDNVERPDQVEDSEWLPEVDYGTP